MHLPSRLAAGAGLLALSLFSLAPMAHGVAAQTASTGHVYVNDNTAKSNTIAAYTRKSDGSLTPIPGSPFPTGGAGTGMIIGSAGALEMTSDGKYLLAVDAGSNQISVLSIAADGSLSPVSGGPVSSGGKVPVSIAIHDDLVYVANLGDGKTGSNYTGFHLDGTGDLTPIANSTVALSPTATPGDILFDSTGAHLVGTEVGPDAGPSYIDSFTVKSDGTLTAAPGSPFPAQATGPFGSVFSPTDASKLYVSNAHAGPNLGSVSGFTVTSDGTLKSIGASPFADRQTAPCWLEISADGKYVYAINTAVASISSYKVESDGSLTVVGSTVFNDPTGLRPFDARLDASGKYLFVVDAGLAKVSIFKVDGAKLTEISGSLVDLPKGATPFGIVAS